MTHPPYLSKSIAIGDTGPYLLVVGSIPKYSVSHTTTSFPCLETSIQAHHCLMWISFLFFFFPQAHACKRILNFMLFLSKHARCVKACTQQLKADLLVHEDNDVQFTNAARSSQKCYDSVMSNHLNGNQFIHFIFLFLTSIRAASKFKNDLCVKKINKSVYLEHNKCPLVTSINLGDKVVYRKL